MTFTKSPLSRTKPRKCPECHQPYVKTRNVQPTCGALPCQESYAIKVAAKAAWKREKMQWAADRAQRESLKTLTQHADEAQRAFNAVRRAEDLAAGHGCISCDTHTAIQWQAGHYMNVKTHKALRFNPDNVHLQCSQCNCDEGGNKIEYRKRLVKRIGVAKVEALECDHEIKRYTIEELKAIKAENVAKLKELRK